MIPSDLFEITDKHFIIDMMYATQENMTGCAVYERIGFGNRALVCKEMWYCLQKLIPYLEENNLKLKIRDAYRPPIAHQMLHDIIPMPGFFAATPERSRHCIGAAIDCGLCNEDGVELVYPTQIDAYDEKFARQIAEGDDSEFKIHLQKARHDYQNPELLIEIANREHLKQLMESIGLESIIHEWWHYNTPMQSDISKKTT